MFTSLSGPHRAACCSTVGLIAALFLAIPGPAAAYEIQVNTTIENAQYQPSVAGASTGYALATWVSFDSGERIRGRFFDRDGAPLGPDFVVSTGTSNNEHPVAVATPEEEFVVLWEAGGRYSIWHRRYLADGTPAGAEVELVPASCYYGCCSDLYNLEPKGALSANGNLLLVWVHQEVCEEFPDWYCTSSVEAQLFAPDLTPLGPRLTLELVPDQLFNCIPASHWDPEVTLSPAGEFLVTTLDRTSSELDGRRFSTEDAALLGDFQVSLAGAPNSHSVLAGSDRLMAAVETTARDIVVQSFLSAGAPLGTEWVSTVAADNAIPMVVGDVSGDLVVAWHMSWWGSGSTHTAIRSRRISWDLDLLGPERRVDTLTGAWISGLASAPGIIMWASSVSSGDDDSGACIRGSFHAPLFLDGVETGDTSAWSLTIPYGE